MEGTRPLLVEIGADQPVTAGQPAPDANGVDMNRLLLITAVLTRRLGFRLGEQDVFVNVIGGLRISEPAADGSCCSNASSCAMPLCAPTPFSSVRPDYRVNCNGKPDERPPA